MSTDLVIMPPGAPQVPAELARALSRASDDDRRAHRFRPEEIAMAAALLPRFEAACAPARQDMLLKRVEQWLQAIIGGVASPPGDVTFNARVLAVSAACNDLPLAVWTAQTAATALRTERFRFFPAVVDVDQFLRPLAEAQFQVVACLRLIAAAQPDKSFAAMDATRLREKALTERVRNSFDSAINECPEHSALQRVSGGVSGIASQLGRAYQHA